MRRFPALYRMPVFYLLATGAAIGAAVAFGRPTPRDVSVTVPSSLPRPVSIAGDDAKAGPVVAAPIPVAPRADPIARDGLGVRRKVLIPGRDAALRATADGDATPFRLDPPAVRFVLGETPSQLRIGSASGGADGWVARDAAVEWGTRLVARPTPRATRPGVEIFADRACLEASVAGRACPTHRGGACPSEPEDAGRGFPGAEVGWPILGLATIKGADGAPRAAMEVAPIVLESVPTEAERLAPLRPALRHVYVAIVIDTTASMRPTIDAAKDLATGLAAEVARRYADVTLHLGLVEYRDDAPGLGFRARVATPFTDPAGFRGVIASLAPAIREDKNGPECVLDGVALALPGTSGGLDWPLGRAGELAAKLVVLLGDAPDHARDLDRAEALAARARAAGISIATVGLDRPGALSEADRARLDGQWHTLAASSFRPPDPAAGFARPLPPAAIRVDGAAGLADRLRALIDDRVERARDLARLAAAEDEGRLAEYLATRNLSMVAVAPLLDEMRRGDASPRRTRRRVPTVRRGWIVERLGDTRFVTVEALVSRDEAGVVAAELAALSGAGGPASAVGSSPSALVNAIALGELAFLDADRARLSVADQSRRRSALPPPPADRGPWNDRLRSALADWNRLRDAPEGSDPSRTIGGFLCVPFDRIDF